jgi:hypothetical protein
MTVEKVDREKKEGGEGEGGESQKGGDRGVKEREVGGGR